MESWQVAMLVLLALLVGALIPVLVQVQLTLKSVRSAVLRLDPTLTQVAEVAARANRMTVMLEKHSDSVERVLLTAGEVSETLEKLRNTVNIAAAVGSALGPALAAAIASFKHSRAPEASAVVEKEA